MSEATGNRPGFSVGLLPDATASLRALLGELHDGVDILAPCEVRDDDVALDQRAAPLTRSFFRIFRLAANIDAYHMLLETEGLTLVDCDVVGVCRDICERAQLYFELCGVELKFSSDRSSKKIALSTDWLERLLLNLFANALRATAQGGTVSLHLICEDEQVTLVLSDTGCGIPADRLNALFVRQPIPLSPAAPPRGLGLGLPICHLIVEKHGGTIDAALSPHGGTVFTIVLPNAHSKLALFREMKFDYAGGYNHFLVELSDVLPTEAYLQRFLD